MATIIDNDALTQGDNPEGYSQPSIIRCSSSLMFVGHVNDSYTLEIHKSTDEGQTFSLNTSFSVGGSCTFCLVPLTSTKAGLILYDGTNIKYYRTDDSGANWTQKYSSSVSGVTKLLLTYDPNSGKLWYARCYNSNAKLKMYYSTNLGDSWTDLGSLDAYYLYDIDADRLASNCYILYEYNNVLYVRRNTSNIWSFSESNITFHDGKIVIDSTGKRFIFYVRRDTSTSKERLVVRVNEGNEIVIYDPDSDNIIIKGSTSVACDNDDNIYVYYTKKSDEKAYYRKYNSGTDTWESEVKFIDVVNNRINTEKHVLAGSSKVNYIFYKQP